MGSPRLLLGIALLAVVAWFVGQKYEVRGWRGVTLARRGAGEQPQLPPAPRNKGTLRIASFHLTSCHPHQVDNPQWGEWIAGIIGRFDVVALQGLRCERPDTLQRLLDRVNAAGRTYALLAGPSVGRQASDKEQYAFVFDQATVEVDRAACYTVDDPDDLLNRPPLVGWFRTRGPAADQAFTFTLVAVHLDADHVREELNVLDNVFFSVRDDGRGEDDVLLLGTLHGGPRQLGELGSIPGLMTARGDEPTNTRQTLPSANLVFQLPASSEYTGRSGVLDFLREYNLTLEQALQVSEYLPVWAEFSVQEGYPASTVAAAAASHEVR